MKSSSSIQGVECIGGINEQDRICVVCIKYVTVVSCSEVVKQPIWRIVFLNATVKVIMQNQVDSLASNITKLNRIHTKSKKIKRHIYRYAQISLLLVVECLCHTSK